MAVRIIKGEYESCLYCSTTMQAFGPVHSGDNFDLEDFLQWLPQDARKYTDAELNNKYWEWYRLQEEKEFDAEIDL